MPWLDEKEIVEDPAKGSYDLGKQQVLATRVSIELEGDPDWGIYAIGNDLDYVLPYIEVTMGPWHKTTPPLAEPFSLVLLLYEGDPYPLPGEGEIEISGKYDLPDSAKLLQKPSITISHTELEIETVQIAVRHPNGGETWQPGTTHTITWISSSDVGFKVKIELYKGRIFNRLIIGETPNNNGGYYYGGSYDWFIPENQIPDSDYKIRISSTASNTSSDGYSVDNFTITPETQHDNTIYPVKRVAFDGWPDACFGRAVSISGDYAIVGALYDNDSRGSAYIFERSTDGWIQQQPKLTHSYPAVKDDYFGCAVAISGDYAIVGIEGDEYESIMSGSTYIFNRTTTGWRKQYGLIASDRANGDRFGCAVSISGDYAIIGAYGDDDNGTDSGSAYIFKRNGTSWTEQQPKLKAGARGDWFGRSVSINGDYAIVGASFYDEPGKINCGATYIYKRAGTSWIRKAKLIGDARAGDEFGQSVSLSGDYAIIGAIGDDDCGEDSGAAYIFERIDDYWIQRAKLTPPDDEADGDYFGNSVSIDGGFAIVSAHFDDNLGIGSGSAYIFKRDPDKWILQNKLTAPDGYALHQFGRGVSISDRYVIAGAPHDDDTADDSGAAYIFRMIPVDPGTNGLVAHWKLDEATGTIAHDAVGSHHGTLYGNPQWLPEGGIFDGALWLDGNGDYVDTGYTENLATWTISAWVSSPWAPLGLEPTGPVHREQNYQLNWDHSDPVFRGAAALNVNGMWYAASFGLLEANTWYHLAATYDGEVLRSYKNGVPVATNVMPSGNPVIETTSLKLGRHALYTAYFIGTIDDVRIYDKALTTREIAALAQ